MISNIAADRLNKQLSQFYPREHLSYVFEFRIKEDHNQVDFAMAISQKKDLLFFKNQYQKLSNHIKVANWLTDCIQLLENNPTINSYWIEADLNGNEAELIPSLFISPKRSAEVKDYIKFFRVLNFNQICDTSEDLLANCIRVLEGDQFVEHIGIMHSRSAEKTTRLYLKGFNKKTVGPFLDRIGWPGSKEFILSQLDVLSSIEYFTIAIEYNTKWLHTIGVEFHLQNDFICYNQFLLEMEDLNLCSSKEKQSILEILKPKKVKSEIINYKRSLSHFKLNISKKKEIEPKVYIQLTPSYTSVLGF